MAHVDKELQGASFNPVTLSYFLYGGEDQYDAIKKYEALFDKDPLFDQTEDVFLSRQELLKKSVQRAATTYRILKENKELLAMHSPVHGKGGQTVARFTGNHSGFTDHFALFVQTILSQGTPEQIRIWLPKSLNLEILGTYAQTELGHGSNVRGLETIATYQPDSDTFLMHMPNITATKWWPGCLGLMATHAIVYARLITPDHKDHGHNAFIVQIRDEQHLPLPGVEVGDIGPKMGANTLDSGYLFLQNVVVPRENMLAKFQRVQKGGLYESAPSHLSKIAYATMMKSRVIIVQGASASLARGLTIALRYNVFRRQGFVDGKKGISGGERLILDYRIQQYRLFPALATAFALGFVSRKLMTLLRSFEDSVKHAGKDISKIDTSFLPELHATSAGLKAFATEMAAAGLEEARKCCGGQGYALSSGIASITIDFLPAVTYEGDRTPMALQTARALIGAFAGKMPATGSFAYLARKERTVLQSKDPQHLQQVWETVARSAVANAGKQLMAAHSGGMGNDEAWNHCHVALITAAYAHSIFQIVEAFVEALGEVPLVTKPSLTALCQLFALTKLSDISVSVSYLTPKQAQMLDAEVNALLPVIRPDCIALVESFGFSDRLLHGTVIGLKETDIYGHVLQWAKRSPLNHPDYVQSLRKEVLDGFLNKEYLKAPSKL